MSWTKQQDPSGDGHRRGAHARAASLSAQRRHDIALKAVTCRWDRKRQAIKATA